VKGNKNKVAEPLQKDSAPAPELFINMAPAPEILVFMSVVSAPKLSVVTAWPQLQFLFVFPHWCFQLSWCASSWLVNEIYLVHNTKKYTKHFWKG